MRKKEKTIKIIIETGLLSQDEVIKCCDLYGIAGVDYLVLSTGVDLKSPTVGLVRLVRSHLADAVNVKVNRAFKNDNEINEFLEAGTLRIGMLI